MVRALPTLSSKWTYRKPKQTSLKPIRNLIETNCYLVHANLLNSCLLNLHAQGNTQLYNSNIRNRVVRNIVGCPAGERATHVSQNESFANLLRPNVSPQMGQWMFWKQGFPKTLLGENKGNGRGKHMFLLMRRECFSHAEIFQSSHVHMRDFQTAEILTKRTARKKQLREWRAINIQYSEKLPDSRWTRSEKQSCFVRRARDLRWPIICLRI